MFAEQNLEQARLVLSRYRPGQDAAVIFNQVILISPQFVRPFVKSNKNHFADAEAICVAPIHFDIVAVNLDQKQPNFPAHVLPEYLTRLGVPFHIENQDTPTASSSA